MEGELGQTLAPLLPVTKPLLSLFNIAEPPISEGCLHPSDCKKCADTGKPVEAGAGSYKPNAQAKAQIKN
ncbi:hypothetical protein P245_27325 [Comamonas thiooxydans]|uniref:Uncharacterized protein n=1 Tax=Comamonas thiooxydans TaxID=363952 RepID=A0A0E3B697_9BURK|nr:hypothetical protein P245_27325 [Comamonas thiooxydans]